ncbi:MAG: L-piperidine-6-carboxylate dehydrogenase [Bacteroidia bacterium]
MQSPTVLAQVDKSRVFETLGIGPQNSAACTGRNTYAGDAGVQGNLSPVDGQALPTFELAGETTFQQVIQVANKGFQRWRMVPAPKRAEIIRALGDTLRQHKEVLAMLISYEMGKIYQEALGEVQEAIDMCDFAVGLSRQLYGLTMASERPFHRMYEQWHPLGPVGIITAFNFPLAVWAWNAMIAVVCGDATVWKPSEKASLSALATFSLLRPLIEQYNVPEGVFSLILGDALIGQKMACEPKLPLISATGSVRMGRSVAQSVAKRLGRSLLELGGNNAVILTANANLDLALRAVVFGALGTSGQRCTTLRRLLIQETIYDTFVQRLLKVYQQAATRIGNPLDAHTLIGPLIDRAAVQNMQEALRSAQEQGGKLLLGGQVLQGKGYESGCYVVPALVEMVRKEEPPYQPPIMLQETFAPILYLMKYDTLEHALAIQNAVPQGLSSAIFTQNLREAELFLCASGSDCGIANVNIGPSGAEIGGAFGGEKETGGGREAGSDAWKNYMRRQTVTINYGTDLPLAQGIQFEI